MKKRNKLISLVITIAMVVAMIPMSAAMAYGADGIEINEVNFPDANFRGVVYEYDTDANGVLSNAEIAAVTKIKCDNMEINSLQGVENFTSITALLCYNNNLTNLDVSFAKDLQILYCEENLLTTLDVSNNTDLVRLSCNTNRLTKLDVSKNTKLEILVCYDTQIAKLNLSKNPLLKDLDIESTKITKIDISNNQKLVDLVKENQVYPYEEYGYNEWFNNDTESYLYTSLDTEVVALKNPATVKADLTTKFSKTGAYNDVKITWSKVKNADGYIVLYKKASLSADAYVLLDFVDAGTSYWKKDLAAGVKYDLAVLPYFMGPNGETFFSSAPKKSSVTTLKKLNKPTVTRSGSKVKVKWNNIAGETGYQISKSTKKTGTNIVATYKTTTGTYKLVTATKGKTYYYKVRAYKVVNGTKIFGPWSAVKAFKR